MSDRELLEAAARAAGIPGNYIGGDIVDRPEYGQITFWNPLQDDGDALRLAVLMKMEVTIEDSEVWAGHHTEEWPKSEATGNDANAATRRAIVRAAASMGSPTP